jgi:hypothetical protein
VKQWYQEWAKQRPGAPPRESSDPAPTDGYFAKGLSPCHGSRILLDRSRQGGYVSKNCVTCGKSMHVRPSELPDLLCGSCGKALEVRDLDGKNYFYVCSHCEGSVLLTTILPRWSEYFSCCGLATGPFV